MTRKGVGWSSTAGVQRRILDAARRVFARRGYADATVAEIVAEAESSVGSVYHHFGDKDGLFNAVADEIRDDVNGHVDPDRLVHSYLRAVWPHQDIMRVLMSPDTPTSFSLRDCAYDMLSKAASTGNQRADRVITAMVLEAVQMALESDSVYEVDSVADDVAHWVDVVREAVPRP